MSPREGRASEAGLNEAVLRVLLQRPILADTMEEGLDVLAERLGGGQARAALAEAVQTIVAAGLAPDPVRLPPGALQCHWKLELTSRGKEAATG